MKKLIFAAAVASSAFVAHANPTLEHNDVLTNKDGRALYTFDKDTDGKSACNGSCATAWPPFIVSNASLAGGDFSVLTREDGRAQWAYKNMPLYFYVGDAKAGDITGDKQGGVWHVVRSAKKPGAESSGQNSGSAHSKSSNNFSLY